MRNRLIFTRFHHVAIAASVVGCSLFVSLDDLNDGIEGADSSIDGAPSPDATPNDGSTLDAGFDSGVYFVVDTCVTDPTDVVNLTTAGPIDWVHYGSPDDTDVKNVSTHVIGQLLQSSNGGNVYSDDPRTVSWTDGTSHPAVTGTSYGQYDSAGPMVLTVDADPARRVLTLYLGTFSVAAHVNISMTPGPAASSQILQTDPGGGLEARCVVHFASPVSAEIEMTYQIDSHLDAGSNYGNIAFMAATVAPE